MYIKCLHNNKLIMTHAYLNYIKQQKNDKINRKYKNFVRLVTSSDILRLPRVKY